MATQQRNLSPLFVGGWCYCFVLFLFDFVYFGPHSNLTFFLLCFCFFVLLLLGGGGFLWGCKSHPRKNETTQAKNIRKCLVFLFLGGGGCALHHSEDRLRREPPPPHKINTHTHTHTRHKQLVSQNPTTTPLKTTSILPKSFLICPSFLVLLLFFFFNLHSCQFQKARWC